MHSTGLATELAVASFDAPRILETSQALAVLKKLAASLRSAGYKNRHELGANEHVFHFALGWPVGMQQLSAYFSPLELDLLLEFGAADRQGDLIAPRFALFAAGSVIALVPHDTCVEEVAYLGPDSLCLLKTVWRLAPGGNRAVELGSGTGFLAAVLSRRYRWTLATDLYPWTVAVAGITLALNPHPGSTTAACTADVTEGLRPGSFDLVAANPPWVPHQADHGPPRLFADGGPTGFELPRRFIMEGSALLAKGGLGIFQCLDLCYAGGGRPLGELCGELERKAYVVEVREAPVGDGWPDHSDEFRALLPEITQARLAAVLVRRR